jgi:hypothetical protein
MNGRHPVGDPGARGELAGALPQLHSGGTASGPSDDGRWADPGDDDDGAPPRIEREPARWAALPDGRRARLRSLLRQVELAVLPLRSAHGGPALRDLDECLGALTVALDLGPEPAIAPCPVCGRLGMAGATVCGFCWTTSPARG